MTETSSTDGPASLGPFGNREARGGRPLRNGVHGYGLITRTLHWITVALLAAQVLVGYTMSSAAEGADSRVDAFEDAGEAAAEQRGEAAEERFEREVERRQEAANAQEHAPSGLHVGLGVALLGLGLGRLGWRRMTPLPPWSDRLSMRDRRLQAGLEKALLALLLLVPVSGLLLLVVDDLVALHVASHIGLYLVITAHVGLVVIRRTTRRMITGSDRAT